jgi:hypothetical protein
MGNYRIKKDMLGLRFPEILAFEAVQMTNSPAVTHSSDPVFAQGCWYTSKGPLGHLTPGMKQDVIRFVEGGQGS